MSEVGNRADMITVKTRFGTLYAKGNQDNEYPSVWVGLLKPNGEMVTVAVVESTWNNKEYSELRTEVYSPIEGHDPKDIVINVTSGEFDEDDDEEEEAQ